MADKLTQQIIDKILELLKADTDLAAIENDNIVQGPPGVKDTYPYISVIFGGGPIRKIGVRDEEWTQDFQITVFDQVKANTATAEKNVLNYMHHIKEHLDANYTLGDLVKESRTSRTAGDTVVLMTAYGKVNARIAGAMLTLTCVYHGELPKKT